jgi:N-methylhydantoinase B
MDRSIAAELVRNEIIIGRIKSICDEMAARTDRAAFSLTLSQGRDFSQCITDGQGNVIAHADRDNPAHLGTLEYSAKAILEDFEDDIHPGDMFISNDPYRCGVHINDVRVLRPVFFDGELVACAMIIQHWADVGGKTPGSVDSSCIDPYQEGVHIPPIKFYEQDKENRNVVKLLLQNMRAPWERYGDLSAEVGAVRYAESRMIPLFEKYGKQAVKEATHWLWDRTEEIIKAEASELPDGEWEMTDHLSKDIVSGEELIPVRMKLIIKGDQFIFDLTDNREPVKAALNTGRPLTCSGVIGSFLNIYNHIPFMNHGVERAIEIRTKPNTLCHAIPPVPTISCPAAVYDKVLNMALSIIGLANPKKWIGAQYNIVYVVGGGWDPRYNRSYVMYNWPMGGMPAKPYEDAGPPTMPLFITGCRTQEAEVLERAYPLRITEFAIMQDSEGAGRYAGGSGVGFGWEHYTDGTGVFSCSGDRDRPENAPWGVAGGKRACIQEFVVDPGKSNERRLGMYPAMISYKNGSSFWYNGAGGGGYGDPYERDPKAVLEQVKDEYISLNRAREVYGVVVKFNEQEEDYELDEEATARVRNDHR